MYARKVYQMVVGIGCTVLGPWLIIRALIPLPATKDLKKVSGVVRYETGVRSTRRSKTKYHILIVGKPSNQFKYLDWFPRSSELKNLVKPEDFVTVWVNAGKNDWVWQIKRDGEVVISHAEVSKAVSANSRFDWLFGIGLFALGIFLIRKWLQKDA